MPRMKHCATCDVREDAANMQLEARQQLKAFLLRHGRIYPCKTAWSRMHLRWIADRRFGQSADQLAFAEYQHAVEDTQARVERLSGALGHSALVNRSHRW